MAKKKKCPECPAGEKWAVPYADFLSLLLALFIALYAISATNTEKVKALKTEFVKIFDYAPKPDQMQPVITIPPNPGDTVDQTDGLRELGSSTEQEKTQESIIQIIQQGGVLEQVDEGIVLKLPTNLLFPVDATRLEDQDSQLFLKRVAEIIKRLPKGVRVDVRGFANNPSIASTPYRNNYELGSARALSVMEELIKNGISPQQIFFSSQGQYGKKTDAINKKEEIIKANRVEIYFFVPESQTQQVQDVLKDFE